jgi:nicotinic acid mononucleotide adenylyltransferase
MQKQFGIISLGGAFNPVHTQHLAVLDLAKTWLEATDKWSIIGGYLAIAPDGYVSKKLNKEAIKLKHRSEMAKLSYQHYPWMAEQPSWDFIYRHHGSAEELGKQVHKALGRKDVQVMIIVGADRIRSKDTPKWRRKLKDDAPVTICVGRGELMSDVMRKWEQDISKGLVVNPDKWVLIDASAEDVSSTQVRQRLKDMHFCVDETAKQEVVQSIVQKNLLFQDVADYILRNEDDLYVVY